VARSQEDILLGRYKEFIPDLHVRVEKSAAFGLLKTELRFSRPSLSPWGIDLESKFDSNGFVWLTLPDAEPILGLVESKAKDALVFNRAPKRLGRTISSLRDVTEIEKRILDMSAQEWATKIRQAYRAYVDSTPESADWGDTPLNANAFVSTKEGRIFIKKFLEGSISMESEVQKLIVPQPLPSIKEVNVEVQVPPPLGPPAGEAKDPPMGPRSTRQ
jgi:hypothetical protein